MSTRSNFVKIQFLDQRNFVICNECFWCATELSDGIQKCPVYTHSHIERIPMAATEKSFFGYDSKRGITLSFSSSCNSEGMTNT